jgi:uncharacterized protein YjeT (DUF2065 family)
MTWAIVAIALVFIAEGLLWVFAPTWMVETLAKASPNELRGYGVFIVVVGAAIMWFLR